MKNKTQHLIPPAYGYRLLLLSLSRVQHFATAWTAAHQGSLPFTIAWSLLKLMSIKSAMPSNHLVLFRTLLNLIPSFPASGSFPMSHLFTSGGQSTGASASSSVLQRKIQGWFPLGLTFLICLWSKGLTTIFSRTVVQKHQFFTAQPSLWSSSHTGIWLLGKPYVWLHRICWQSDVSAF